MPAVAAVWLQHWALTKNFKNFVGVPSTTAAITIWKFQSAYVIYEIPEVDAEEIFPNKGVFLKKH